MLPSLNIIHSALELTLVIGNPFIMQKMKKITLKLAKSYFLSTKHYLL